MQTLRLTITLPDLVQFGSQDALEMQVLFVESLIGSGRIDVRDPDQRAAVVAWYQQLAPYTQFSDAQQQTLRQTLKRRFSLPEQVRPAADIVDDLDAEMERLEKANNWTAATHEQWLTEHLRTAHGRP